MKSISLITASAVIAAIQALELTGDNNSCSCTMIISDGATSFTGIGEPSSTPSEYGGSATTVLSSVVTSVQTTQTEVTPATSSAATSIATSTSTSTESSTLTSASSSAVVTPKTSASHTATATPTTAPVGAAVGGKVSTAALLGGVFFAVAFIL